MFDRKRRLSYADQRKRRGGILRFFAAILSLVVLVYFVLNCLITSIVIKNDTMEPLLKSGDRVIVFMASYGFKLPFTDISLSETAPERGDLVLVEASLPNFTWKIGLADAFVRFFTAQRCFAMDRQYSVKRVVGLPGDSVSMSNYVARVKQSDGTYALTEFELSKRSYDIAQDPLPDGWQDAMPMSSSFSELELGDKEFFILSDQRSAQADSRTWGAVSRKRIVGKLVFRYWPFSRFGIL